MLSPGPPPALHRQAARLQPAHGHLEPPGPTRPRLHGAPRRAAPALPEWAVQRGGGVPGASRPRGAATRKHPASRVSGRNPRGLYSRTQYSSLLGRVVVCLGPWSTQDSRWQRQRVTLNPNSGPGGQRQLVIVQAQRARHRSGRPAPSAPLVEASPPQTHSPTSESRGGGLGSAATHSL